MTTGTIKTKTDKGFGFITVQGSDDVFFHHSACNGQYENLQVGQSVQFDVEQGEKGPKASNVSAASGNDVVESASGGVPESMAADKTMAA